MDFPNYGVHGIQHFIRDGKDFVFGRVHLQWMETAIEGEQAEIVVVVPCETQTPLDELIEKIRARAIELCRNASEVLSRRSHRELLDLD